MIEVRPAVTDEDLQATIDVRRVLYPYESAGSVALARARARESPERLVLLAELDGELAGFGYAGRSHLTDRFATEARVLPDMRRRGVGTALLRELVAHAGQFVNLVRAEVDDDGSRLFAERFGFVERDGQVEQVKTLGAEPAAPALPDGIEVVTVAERPELLRRAYPLACEGYADLAIERPAVISLDEWLRDEATLPACSLVALADGEIVGYSGLLEHDNAGWAEDGLTVVRRDRRRQGIALALKRRKLRRAAESGVREIVTWTQRGNEGMRKLNEGLGYEYRTVSSTMVARLPLPW